MMEARQTAMFDVMLDRCVAPLPRAGEITDDRSEGVPGDGLIREHPERVRELLQRAGLSTNSELTREEVERCERAISGMFPDPNTPSAKIRGYIMPRGGEEA